MVTLQIMLDLIEMFYELVKWVTEEGYRGFIWLSSISLGLQCC